MRRPHKRRPAASISHNWTKTHLVARRAHPSALPVLTTHWTLCPWLPRTPQRSTVTPSDDSRLPMPHSRKDACQRLKRRTPVSVATSVWTFAEKSSRRARRIRSTRCTLLSMLPRKKLLSCATTSARRSRAVLVANKVCCRRIECIGSIKVMEAISRYWSPLFGLRSCFFPAIPNMNGIFKRATFLI